MVTPLCPRGWSIIARYLTWTTHLNVVDVGVRGLKCWTLVRNVGTCQLRKVYRSVAIVVGRLIPAARWSISTGIVVIWVPTAADLCPSWAAWTRARHSSQGLVRAAPRQCNRYFSRSGGVYGAVLGSGLWLGHQRKNIQVASATMKVLPWVVDGAGGLGAGKTSGAGTRGVDLNAAVGGRTGYTDTNGGESSNNGSKIHADCYPAENPSL